MVPGSDESEVERDTKAADALAKLPATVTAIYSDDTDSEAGVTWNTNDLSDKDFAKRAVKPTICAMSSSSAVNESVCSAMSRA